VSWNSMKTILTLKNSKILFQFQHNRINRKVCNVGLGVGVWKKHKMKLFGAPKLRFDGVWCRNSFVLFLVKPSSKLRSISKHSWANFTINFDMGSMC